eukprot:68298_1
MSEQPVHEAKQSDNDDQATLNLLTSSISVCIATGHTRMDAKVTEAARKYYLSIVNNELLTIEQQQHKIYEDLVLRTKSSLMLNPSSSHSSLDPSEYTKLSLTYRVGLDSDTISVVNGLIICIGNYKENDICIPSPYVSRIHCFIFQVNDTLIVLDGWSKLGTRTVKVAPNQINHMHQGHDEEKQKMEPKLISSLPKERNILQFNVTDTIHLIVGDPKYGTHFIINPKPCIVCIGNARTVRLECGHQVLCTQCYIKIKQTIESTQCPICRKKAPQATISAGVYTFACSSSDPSHVTE